jgi:hypothetical protein
MRAYFRRRMKCAPARLASADSEARRLDDPTAIKSSRVHRHADLAGLAADLSARPRATDHDAVLIDAVEITNVHDAGLLDAVLPPEPGEAFAESAFAARAASTPQRDMGSGRPTAGALWHPERADCWYHAGNVVIGGSQELFAVRARRHGSVQRSPDGVAAMKQDRQQKPMFGPGTMPRFHRRQEPHAPGTGQDRSVVGALKDRVVPAPVTWPSPR